MGRRLSDLQKRILMYSRTGSKLQAQASDHTSRNVSLSTTCELETSPAWCPR